MQYFYGFSSPKEIGELTPFQFNNYIEQAPEILKDMYGDDEDGHQSPSHQNLRKSQRLGKQRGLIK